VVELLLSEPHDVYKIWCQTQGHRPFGVKKFSGMIRQLFSQHGDVVRGKLK